MNFLKIRKAIPYTTPNFRYVAQGKRIYGKEEPIVEALKKGNTGKAIRLCKEIGVTPKRFASICANGFVLERWGSRIWIYLYDHLVDVQYIDNPEMGHVPGKNLVTPDEISKSGAKNAKQSQ